MRPTLVTTCYRFDDQPCEYTRAYLGTREESACAQADAWFAELGTRGDSGREVHQIETDITTDRLNDCYPDRKDLLLAVGRIYALDAIAQGAPAIPEGLTYAEWSRDIDVDTGCLSEWLGEYTYPELAIFFESYKKNLFHESPCDDSASAARQGEADGREDADTVYSEQGIAAIRLTQAWTRSTWEDGARSAGAFEMTDFEPSSRAAYYAAYDRGARERASEIVAEEDRLAREEEVDDERDRVCLVRLDDGRREYALQITDVDGGSLRLVGVLDDEGAPDYDGGDVPYVGRSWGHIATVGTLAEGDAWCELVDQAVALIRARQ